MDRKKGLFVIIFLILVLGMVDAAWIFYNKSVITANVIGEPEEFFMSQQFDNSLSLNTTDGPDSVSTMMIVNDLTKDINLTLESITKRYNETAEDECAYEDDCNVTIAYVYESGVKEILIDRQISTTIKANVTFFGNYNNKLEYKIECVEDSCPQRIVSNVTLEQI